MEGRIGEGAVVTLKAVRKFCDVWVILEIGRSGLNEVHAGLPVEGTTGAYANGAQRLICGVVCVGVVGGGAVFDLDDVLLMDDVATLLCEGFFFGAGAGEFEKLDARRTDGMGPVDGTFRTGDAAGNFVEEVGGGMEPLKGVTRWAGSASRVWGRVSGDRQNGGDIRG